MKKSHSAAFFSMLSLALVMSVLTHMPATSKEVYATTTSAAALANCPAKNVQHWDKIVFVIKSPELAAKVQLPPNTELDIKVRDNPSKVADIKQKVLEFLNVPTEPRSSIDILQVRYAMICAG